MGMDSTTIVRIIYKIMDRPSVSVNELVSMMKISKKNFTDIVDDFNRAISDTDCKLIVNDSNCTFKVGNRKALKEWLVSNHQQLSFETQQERVQYLIRRFLGTDTYIKIDDLSEEVFVSNRQISKDLKLVRDYLSKYDLELETVPHYGLIVRGFEMKKRICLAELLSSHSIDYLDAKQKEIIKKIELGLEEILQENHYEIADYVFENLVVHLYVSVLRAQKGYEIEGNIGDIEDCLELRIAMQIVSYLQAQLNVRLSVNEKNYIAIHLLGKRNYSEVCNSISSDVGELVIDVLSEIDKKYNTSLKTDFTLCMNLNLHFAPLIDRIRFGLNNKNPLLDEIKEKYIYEFEMAKDGCTVIEKKYNCHLSDDEVGYIALNIRLAMEKRNTENKYRILLVCSTGRGSAELMKIKFMSLFAENIKELKECSVRSVSEQNLDQFDYIFSTVPLFIKTNVPVIRVSCFLSSDEVIEINGIFKSNHSKSSFEKYFDRDLFIPNLDVEDKKTTIERMVEHISKYKEIPDHFLESVYQRESMADTSFGNGVAFPHPQELLTDTTFVCVAVLNKPIDWGNGKKVSLILMASIENTKNRKLQNFYKMLSKIVNNPGNVDRIVKNPSYEVLREVILK